jgi:putative PIN family toxin of toxin-antitoxin system
MRRIVLDTSVFVAAARSGRGASNKLLGLIGSKAFETVISVPLVLEYEDALMRHLTEFVYTAEDVQELLDFVCAHGRPQPIYYLWRPLLPDPGDDHVLEVAMAARCDTIVTFNVRHFAGAEQFGVGIRTPGAFYREIKS